MWEGLLHDPQEVSLEGLLLLSGLLTCWGKWGVLWSDTPPVLALSVFAADVAVPCYWLCSPDLLEVLGGLWDGESCSLVCAAVQLFEARHAAVHQKTQSAGNSCWPEPYQESGCDKLVQVPWIGTALTRAVKYKEAALLHPRWVGRKSVVKAAFCLSRLILVPSASLKII